MQITSWDNGIHKVVFEEPDVAHCYVNGPMTGEEAQVMERILREEIKPRVNEFYLMTHLAPGVEGLSQAARRHIGNVKPFWRALIMVGGNSSIVRATGNILLRAMNLLAMSPVPTRMVKTVDEAYAFVNELRGKATPMKQSS